MICLSLWWRDVFLSSCHPSVFAFPRGLLSFNKVVVLLDIQASLILVLSVVEHVSAGFCGLEYLMAMSCDSFVMVLNYSILVYTHSHLMPWGKVTGSSYFISSTWLIIIHTHTHMNTNTALLHLPLAESFLCLSYSFQSPFTSSVLAVLIASPFLVQMSWEGSLGWDAGLVLGCTVYFPPVLARGFTASGREWMYLLHLPWGNIYRPADVFGTQGRTQKTHQIGGACCVLPVRVWLLAAQLGQQHPTNVNGGDFALPDSRKLCLPVESKPREDASEPFGATCSSQAGDRWRQFSIAGVELSF